MIYWYFDFILDSFLFFPQYIQCFIKRYLFQFKTYPLIVPFPAIYTNIHTRISVAFFSFIVNIQSSLYFSCYWYMSRLNVGFQFHSDISALRLLHFHYNFFFFTFVWKYTWKKTNKYISFTCEKGSTHMLLIPKSIDKLLIIVPLRIDLFFCIS